jgi:Tn3 transposase DDE domain
MGDCKVATLPTKGLGRIIDGYLKCLEIHNRATKVTATVEPEEPSEEVIVKARPLGVVRSRASLKETKPTLTDASSCRVEMRSRSITPIPTATSSSILPPSVCWACASVRASAAFSTSASTGLIPIRDYGPLAPLVSRADRFIDTDLISEQWDRMGQLYASLKTGHVTASVALKRLVAFSAKNRFYRANREFSRIFKTEFILQYLSELELRGRIRRGILKVEQLHALARDVFYGRRGRIKPASYGNK